MYLLPCIPISWIRLHDFWSEVSQVCWLASLSFCLFTVFVSSCSATSSIFYFLLLTFFCFDSYFSSWLFDVFLIQSFPFKIIEIKTHCALVGRRNAETCFFGFLDFHFFICSLSSSSDWPYNLSEHKLIRWERKEAFWCIRLPLQSSTWKRDSGWRVRGHWPAGGGE